MFGLMKMLGGLGSGMNLGQAMSSAISGSAGQSPLLKALNAAQGGGGQMFENGKMAPVIDMAQPPAQPERATAAYVDPVVSAPNSKPAALPPTDMRQGIIDTANALGIDPVDLATAISYETAGTFDATKRGPTTQWGQHRGLIQFGEPQAREYGVDWNNPVGSQLGPDGAVAKYLRKAGVKPGMGLLDVYSAINAGGVGLYNRSDANNGGAPGTVSDKVRGMHGHRAKAVALLGGEFTPQAPSAMDRVLASVGGPGGNTPYSPQAGSQTSTSTQQAPQQPMSVGERVLASIGQSPPPPLPQSDAPQVDPAVDLGAEEVALLQQKQNEDRIQQPSSRKIQRKQGIRQAAGHRA